MKDSGTLFSFLESHSHFFAARFPQHKHSTANEMTWYACAHSVPFLPIEILFSLLNSSFKRDRNCELFDDSTSSKLQKWPPLCSLVAGLPMSTLHLAHPQSAPESQVSKGRNEIILLRKPARDVQKPPENPRLIRGKVFNGERTSASSKLRDHGWDGWWRPAAC